MQRSVDRILTTHVGSLARPRDVLDLMRAKAADEPYDAYAYVSHVRRAVTDCVRQQLENGIDIVTDGEQGKLGFSTYVGERLTGFEERPNASSTRFKAEQELFPEYYQHYFNAAMQGARVATLTPLVCTGPVSYRGEAALHQDIDNLKAALDVVSPVDAFIPVIAPSGVGENEYYASEEEYLFAVAEALRVEYRTIVDAGFNLQVDDPFLTTMYSYAPLPEAEKRRKAEMHVEAINYTLRGISEDKIRFHTCYGINEGPRVLDTPLAGIVELILQVTAGAYSFEAANPRHEHEYHVWETVQLPEGKILLPGVVTHSTNIVEHPELIAERIVRYAELVGRENVIASTDCGFSSHATYNPEVHPTVVWAKFQAMAEGARKATARLWRRHPAG